VDNRQKATKTKEKIGNNEDFDIIAESKGLVA
jgi:hypothetical protein